MEFACLSSSVRRADLTPERRREEREAFAAYAELARFLGCSLVRVFGGNLASGGAREIALPEMAAFLRDLGQIAGELWTFTCATPPSKTAGTPITA